MVYDVQLLKVPLRIQVGEKFYTISPVERDLSSVEGRLDMTSALYCEGGLIVGEGDTGKTTYVKMLECIAKQRGLVAEIVYLREPGWTSQLLRETVRKLKASAGGNKPLLILDGLDENPSLVSTIADLSEEENDIVLWVTCRATEEAQILQRARRFESPYKLSNFSHWDIFLMLHRSGIDPEFAFNLANSPLEDFIRKPGGVVILLELYLRGRLTKIPYHEIMEEVVSNLARETRNGHTSSSLLDDFDPTEIVNLAEWIAACLFMTGKFSLWVGNSNFTPKKSLAVENIPLRGFKPRLLAAALERRLFEPLNANEFRISYAEANSFLIKRWFTKRHDINRMMDKLREKRDSHPKLTEKFLHNTITGADNIEFVVEHLLYKLHLSLEDIMEIYPEEKTNGVTVASFSPGAIQQLQVAVNGPITNRDEAIRFIRALYRQRSECASWTKTVNYVRYLNDDTNPDFAHAAEIRSMIAGMAKKVKNGEDKVWNSLVQQSKLSHAKRRKSDAPGIVPILDKGADYL